MSNGHNIDQPRSNDGRFGHVSRSAPDSLSGPGQFAASVDDFDIEDVDSIRDADTEQLWDHVTSPDVGARYHAARATALDSEQVRELLDPEQPFSVRHAAAATPAAGDLAATDPDPLIRHRVYKHGFIDDDTRSSLADDPHVQAVERLLSRSSA